MNQLLYVIILNYNGCEDTLKCVESVRRSSYQNLKILVVDNNSKDNSVDRIKKECKDVEILKTNKNLGFAGGNNKGIIYALERNADYICLLNNDVLVEQNTFEILLERLSKNDKRIVGPATLFWNSGDVHSTGLKINFYKGIAKLINNKRNIEDIHEEEVLCDYLEGTCLLFNRKLIEEIGCIPEIYFLYYEETEWCCQAKKKGYEIVCYPQARIWHKGSASVNKVSGLKLYFEDRNRVLFERRNATIHQRIFFYFYFIVQLGYRIITKQRDIKAISAVFDGLKGRIDWSIYSEK